MYVITNTRHITAISVLFSVWVNTYILGHLIA